ncbi:hypothetical protein STEG23_002754, partial [Scotinomys teguina]
LNLKDAFFSVPLIIQFLNIFAFTWIDMTPTCLHRCFWTDDDGLDNSEETAGADGDTTGHPLQKARLLGLGLDKPHPAQPQPLADRATPPSPPEHPFKWRASPSPLEKSPCPPLGCRSSQSFLEEESLPKIQEQPVTLGRRGPRSNQSPSEEEDPGAASHQSPSEKENQGSVSHPRRKRILEHPDTIGTRDPTYPSSKAEMGRGQCKSTNNNIKNKTSPESSPPPTPRPEHCNVDKAEEMTLKIAS